MWQCILCCVVLVMICYFCGAQSISRLQLTAGRDSHISISQPWVTQEEGYTTQIYGQVWQPQFTTSLPYPQAANGKSLEVCACILKTLSLWPSFLFPFFSISVLIHVFRSMLACISHESGITSRHGLWISLRRLWLVSSWYILWTSLMVIRCTLLHIL